MLNAGVIYVGQPSIHLHELICVALILEAPLALSDETSFNICKKFSSIIPILLLTENLTLNLFVSDKSEIYTNLQPKELENFFLAHPEFKKIRRYHVLEKGLKIAKSSERSFFCSSFPHMRLITPLEDTWINLGPIGMLSYQKHKKALQKILLSFMPALLNSQYYVSQILVDSSDDKISSEDTLDEIQFLNLAFTGFDKNNHETVIAAHGLIDAATDMTKATIFYDEALSLLSLFYKKPLFFKVAPTGIYEQLIPLLSSLPRELKNLYPLISHYFDFEAIDREKIIKQIMPTLYHQSHFPLKWNF